MTARLIKVEYSDRDLLILQFSGDEARYPLLDSTVLSAEPLALAPTGDGPTSPTTSAWPPR